MLWCSSLKYEECCLLLHTFLTDTNAVKKILLIKTLWKYNKILLFFTMKPRILSWHPDVMLKWRVDGSHGRCWSCPAWPSESCWCPLHQTPGATQLPGPPPSHHLSDTSLCSCRLIGGLVYYPDRCICIITIPLSTVCCICSDMPKWCQLLMMNYAREDSRRKCYHSVSRMNSTRPECLITVNYNLSVILKLQELHNHIL